MLQRQIHKLHAEYQDLPQAAVTVKWNTESLISSFKEETFDIKLLVPQYPQLQKKDIILSEIGKKRVSQ